MEAEGSREGGAECPPLALRVVQELGNIARSASKSGPVRFFCSQVIQPGPGPVAKTKVSQRPDRDHNEPVHISPVAAKQPVETGSSKDWLITSLNWLLSGCDRFC